MKLIPWKEFKRKLKEKEMSDSHRYSFVSTSEDVNLVRVLREAPKATPFILVEEKTRTNQPVVWFLFVHRSVLENIDLKDQILAGETIDTEWGYDEILENNGAPRTLHSYRAVGGTGKFPGYFKQEIEKLRRILNPKERKTDVTYV